MPSASAHEQPVPIECMEGGCTLIPNGLLEKNDKMIEKMMKEILRLRAVTGCA